MAMSNQQSTCFTGLQVKKFEVKVMSFNPLSEEELKAKFDEIMQPEKVKLWGQEKGDEIVSHEGDTVFCPIVEYLMHTGIFESVDITNYTSVWFWTKQEIKSCTEEELEELDDKNSLDLPSWVTAAIYLFDEILASRAVIGHDVVRIIDQSTSS